MNTVFINIGSNLGQRRLNLSRAMKAVGDEFGPYEISHVVESEPWGFESPNKFLNLGMMFRSPLGPEQIMQCLLDIERRLSPGAHRDADGNYVDRAVDIDLIAIDRMVCDTPGLTLPHRHLAERDFFLVPLEELAPGWTHPVTGLTPSQMLERLKDSNDDRHE